jgi:hypothetical protein
MENTIHAPCTHALLIQPASQPASREEKRREETRREEKRKVSIEYIAMTISVSFTIYYILRCTSLTTTTAHNI